jgi:NDP-4-keto-2,6-dideoxyhexose 3-C-methyltransferase
MHALYQEVTSCRICRSTRLRTVLDLGNQALTGRFPAPDEPDPPAAPLRLIRCDDCGLAQLGHDFDPNALFRETYGYRSGMNATMTMHLAGIARAIEWRVGLKPGDFVVDIASNDGTLLNSYSVTRLRRVGIDPTIAQFAHNYGTEIVQVAEFFSAGEFRRFFPSEQARAVTTIAMFYDLADPAHFVSEVASILAEDGIWVLEQSDVGMMLEALSFDTVCHEHRAYYGFSQLRRLVEDAGLRLFDIEFNTINGGSARFYVCHSGGPYSTNDKAIAAASQRDDALRRAGLAPFDSFRSAVLGLRAELCEFLHAEVANGKIIHVYGASTKGNVLLQYFGIDRDLVPAAADRNPVKWGRRTPGTQIPIISEQQSRAADPDYYLVLPWHFRDEFVRREEAFLRKGGKLIFPLPKFEIVFDNIRR